MSERWHDESEGRAIVRMAALVCLMLVLAFALSSLLGCGTAPARVIVPPAVCPALPSTPSQAHTVLPEFLPVLSASVSDADSAGEVLRVRVDSAALYQACRANNAALADWVINHSQE